VKTRNRLLCLILVLTMLLGVMPMAGAEDAENALWYTNGPSERREFSGSTTVNKGDTWNFKFYYGTEASSAVVTSGTLASSDSSVVRVTQNAYGDWDAAMAAAGTATLTFTPNNSSGSFTMNVTVTESASGEDTGDDVEPSDLWYAVSDGSGGEDSPVLFTSLTSAVEGSTRSVYLYYGTSDSIGTAERCTTGTFTSSDSSVISVSGPSSDLYTISFLKPGTATLTYTYGGMTFETTVTVKIRVPDASLCDAAPADGPAYLGSEFTFTDNYREFYFAVIAQCPLVINKEAMTINSGAGYVDVEYISGDVNYYKFTVNDNAPTDTSFVLSISCAVYDSLMETDSVFNQSLTLKYSSNDDDAGGNYEGTGSNSDLPEIYDGKALYLDDYVIGFGFDSAVDGSAESNLTINEKTWEYANSTTVAKDEANERYQWRDFTVYAGTKHTDAAGSEYYLEAPANKVTVTVNKMWVELKSGDEGTFSWSDDKSTTVLTKDDFGTDVSAYLYVKNGYVGAGQVWANVTATTNNGNTATGDIAVNIRIERNENLFHTRPANDTTEDLNAFLAELAADYDFTEEITYNITLAATTYEGTIVIPPEFDDTPGISLNLNLSGTSIEGTKVNGGIDLDGSSVSWMSDIIFTANENVTTDAGITSAVYNGKIGHISNCFFRGYDVAVDASEGMINLARDNVLVDNDVAFRIDVADNIGNSRNNWTGNTFIKNSTAIQILSYNDFISPYHFRIWDSNFIGNTKDFYFGADGTVYMYGNYFGNIHNQAQSMGLCEYMEALEQIKTSSAYSSQKLVTTNSPNSDKAGGVKAKLVTSPGRKKVLLDWWKLDSSISDAFDTANTAAYSLLSLSTQTVSDTDTYDNPLVAIWDQETEILNSSASKLLIDASSFETATETDRIITVVDNDGNPIGIWNFGKEAFTGLTGTFNAGLTIDTSVSGQISVTVAESDLLSVLAPTLTIPTDYTDASVIGNDDTGTIDEEGNLSFTVSTAGTYDIESHELWFTVGPGALLMFSDPGTPTVGTSWSPIFAYGAKSEVTTNNEINQSDRLSGTLSVTPADSTVITFGDYDSVIFSAAGTATLNYTTTIDGEERVFSTEITVVDGSGGASDDTTNSGLYFCTYADSPGGWQEGSQVTFDKNHPPMQVAMGQSVIIHLYLDGTQLDGGTWTVADSTKLSVSETSSGNYTLTGLAFGSTDLTYNDGTTDYTMGVEIGLPILGYYSEQNRSQDTYLTSLDYNSESGNEVWLMSAFGFTEDQMGTLSCEVNRNTSTEISAEKVAWTSDSTKYDIKVTIPGNLTINEFTVRGNNFIWALTVTGGSGSGGSIDGSAAYRTYKKTEYAIGFTWKLSDSETVINEGKFGILQTAIDTDDTGYAFLADVDGIAVGKKETDSEGNDYYIVPTESYDKLPITVTVNKVWVDKDGYLSFSKTEKVTEVASPTFPVTLYAQNESFHALLYAEVDITIDGETATETVSFGLGQRLKVKVDCSDLSDIDVLNAKLQELAANAQDGIGYIITLPEELTGTILIPSNYHGFEFEGADGSTKLNGAININGALVGKLTNVTFFATDVAKTAIYGGACGNVIDCFFYNYDIAIDSTAGLVTVTEGNIFAENVIAVKLDLKDSDNSINRVPWTHNSFIMNDTAIKVVSLHEKFSSFYFRITDSNFIGNETNFDIASGTKVYMYKNFYGKLHSSWDSDTCNVFDYMLALKDVTTETEFHNQKLVIQNNEGKGVGNKVVSNPQWKYPVADWWVDGNKLVGGNSTYSLLNNDAETPYTNVLISDWESETEIINSEANDLTIDASAFAEATDADKVVTVVDNNENLLGTWTFATDVSNGIAVVSNDTDSSAFNAKLTIVEKDEDSFTVTVENSDVLSTYAPTLTVPCAYTGAYVTCDGKEVESAVDTGKRTISFTVAKGGVYTIVKKFNIDGATMTLGNSLAINFFSEPTDLVEGEGYYAVITKEYADGRGNVTVRIDQADWSYHNGYEQHYVTFNGVAAKEMTDELTVTVYNSSGVAVSNEWVDSVRDYTMRMLSKQTDAEKLALYVDMLNYGAAAQTYFDDYNSDDLANSQLTDTQKGYATGEVTMTDSRVQGTGYSASNLTLESDITLNVFFKKDYIDQTKYAVASFTDHYGNEKSVRVEGSAFKQLENDTDWYVPVKGLVVADVRQPVTVTVYNSDGTVSASCTDSIESYVARMSSENALYEAIMKFGVSAYAYFH